MIIIGRILALGFLAALIYVGVVTYTVLNTSTAAPIQTVAPVVAPAEDCKEEGLYADAFAYQARDLEYSKSVLDDSIGLMRYRQHTMNDAQQSEAMTAVDFLFDHPEIRTDAIGVSLYALCLRRHGLSD